MKICLIANLENRRAQYFRDACQRLALPQPTEIDWSDWLNGEQQDLNNFDLVRLDSPGENFKLEKHLIALGGGPADLEEDFGRLRCQVPWFRGWSNLLEAMLEHFPKANYMNHPTEIALMFDKWNAQQHLHTNGVSVPQLIGQIDSYDQLIEQLESQQIKRAFIKPSHSSSASGVVAFQMANRERVSATTSVEVERGSGNLYNSLRLRRYLGPDQVGDLITRLLDENMFAEAWFPKARYDGSAFDLRVLVIAGKPQHVVARTSKSPITNLHLGNQRGDLEQISDYVGKETWELAMQQCTQAAMQFPNSHYLAVDLMIGSALKRVAVAEVNAFGDLIPNIVVNDQDSYTAELSEWVRLSR